MDAQYPAPGGEQQYAPGPPQPPAKRNRTLLIAGIVAAALLLCCCASSCVALLVFRGSSSQKYQPWSLSSDQQRVLAEFGRPQTFTLHFGEVPKESYDADGKLPVHRVEVWDYYELRTRFVFRDGKAMGRRKAPAPPKGTAYPELDPKAFNAGMSVADVVSAIGSKPDKGLGVAEELMKKGTVYSFGGGQVVALFDDGKLLSIQTVPVAEGGGEQ